MRLCQPLALSCRDALLRILAHELRGRRDVGDGELHRIARTIIKENRLFDPPLETEPPQSPPRQVRTRLTCQRRHHADLEARSPGFHADGPHLPLATPKQNCAAHLRHRLKGAGALLGRQPRSLTARLTLIRQGRRGITDCNAPPPYSAVTGAWHLLGRSLYISRLLSRPKDPQGRL
jgi:hypothetical protein